MLLGKIGNEPIDDVSITGVLPGYVDSSVKLALLTTIAGYLENDKITVNGDQVKNPRYLNNFLSYILNDSRAAPRTFNLQIDFNKTTVEREKPNDDNNYEVLLSFSGGVDSTAGLLHALDRKLKVKPVFICFGQKNEKEEIATVRNILKKLNIELIVIKINIDKYIDHDWSRWKLGIIPARNYLFASFAASMLSRSPEARQIWICAHKEEINPINTDKSSRFFGSSSKIFSEYYKKEITVFTPFKKITKPEIVSYWNKNWVQKYGLNVEDTVSCYFGNNCGTCKACLNRAIAFTCAGVTAENFQVNPYADSDKLIENSYVKRFSSLKKERKLDFLYALMVNKEALPQFLQEFVSENYPNYEKDISRRINYIRNIEKI